ncbi:MAG: prepilin-type N-terminal cleavage/methylation domain-containing protein [Archangium sp.]|nr:prepilin-type N-terminal cleavage/methylation domain-containing protein [Archangium sp.]
MRAPRAFTLLEVVVALAILAVSLVAILDINSQAVVSHVYAKKLTVATLLARSKMTDIEQELYDKPLNADDDEDSGDFSDEGFPSFKWRSKIIVPKTNGLSPDQLIGALLNIPMGGEGEEGGGMLSGLLGSLGGGGANPSAQGPGGGLAGALGPMAGLMQGQFTQMVDKLQKSVREVHLTVSWKEGKLTESIDLATHIVSMGPGSDRNGGAAAVAAANGAPPTQQWVRADNGVPVSNPKQAPNGNGFVDPVDGTPLVMAGQNGSAAAAAGALVPGGLGNLPPNQRALLQRQGIFK